MPYFLLIFLGFPFLELLFSLWIGSVAGGWSIAWLFLGTLLGVFMLRHQRIGMLLPFFTSLRTAQHSLYQRLWPLRYLLSGALFIFPGFLSDLFAIVLLLPLFRSPESPTHSPFNASPHTPNASTFEGEYQHVNPRTKPSSTLPDPSDPSKNSRSDS